MILTPYANHRIATKAAGDRQVINDLTIVVGGRR
jgi:hypothetical protein